MQHNIITRLKNLLLLVGLAAALVLPSSFSQQTNIAAAAPLLASVPSGFTDNPVTNIASPTALAFTPDGRLLITSRNGSLVVFKNGANITALTISRLCTNHERGLLGVAADPNFASNNFIYLYYTFNKFNQCPLGSYNASANPVNRVSRFTLSSGNSASGEKVLVDNIPSAEGYHNGGDMHFGKDGLLYISVGDSACQLTDCSRQGYNNGNARRKDILAGKILRVSPVDGNYSGSNPWAGQAGVRRCGNPVGVPAGNGPCGETFAWGLRNPFRFAMDPNASGTRFYINDVGQNVCEEIDLGQAGADYGYNVVEGGCGKSSPAGMTPPIYSYDRSAFGGNCKSITGGAFVPNGVWGSAYAGGYLFADYVCNKIMLLKGSSASVFASGLGGPSHLTFNNGALYYANFNAGQVRRIDAPGSGNHPPTAVISASPTSGSAPLNVNFSGSGSSDPDGDAITSYTWDFGDGSTGSGVTTSHTYAKGSFTARLTVKDSKGASSTPATVQISAGNSPPAPKITAPASNKLFKVGEVITLQGTATDPEDGTLPASKLSWVIIKHHDDHVHPFDSGTGSSLTITAPAPEDPFAATNSYLEIQLTATDSQGVSQTISQRLDPRKVNLTFNTAPSGLKVTADGVTLTGPQTIVAWEAQTVNVTAPTQTASGKTWNFQSWSDGKPASHAITAPASAASYTGTFKEGGVSNMYEAESGSLSGGTKLSGCSACSGGQKVGFIGNGAANFVTINNINVASSGSRQLTIQYLVNGTRSFSLSVNGGAPVTVTVSGTSFSTPASTTINVSLNAGNNTIKFFNNSAYAPDLDRISISNDAQAFIGQQEGLAGALPPPATRQEGRLNLFNNCY